MRLLDRLTSRYRDQGYYEGMASGAAVLMTYGVDSKREIPAQNLVAAATQAYETNGVVFACILARMMLLSEATFKFRNLTDKSLYGTEDLRILEYPWPNGTAGELWASLELAVSTAGNSFTAKLEDDLLLRLPAVETTIVSQETVSTGGVRYKEVIGYDWDPDRNVSPGAKRSAKAQFFPVEEVSHWSPIPDPLANWRGMAWLTAIMREVYADSAMTTYKSVYLDHGSPLAAVKYPMKLRPETIDAIIDRVQARFGGAANSGKTLVFDNGADPVMGAGLKELDYAAVQAVGEERICAAAGVPPAIIGLKTAEDNSSYQTEMRRFADLTIRPLWRSGCAALQKLVPNVPARGVQLWFDTSDIAALQAAETERAQVTQVNAAAILTLVQAGHTRESVIAAVNSGDLSLLVPDPAAPTPGVAERETITAAESAPVTGPDSTVGSGRPAKIGSPPGGPQASLTKAQTPASKRPAPASFPTPALTTAPNGKGH